MCVLLFQLSVAKRLLCQHLRFLSSKSLEETAVYLCLEWAPDQGWGWGQTRPTAI